MEKPAKEKETAITVGTYSGVGYCENLSLDFETAVGKGEGLFVT